jgi:hypothetical protein
MDNGEKFLHWARQWLIVRISSDSWVEEVGWRISVSTAVASMGPYGQKRFFPVGVA